MERNREVRRASIAGSNGFNGRRHRTNSLRDSPDEDGGVELQESVRLRDRTKRDRNRERERDRDLRERSSRSKRRRAERFREDIGGDETSDESGNDDEDDEYEETTTAGGGRLLPTPPQGSISNHHHQSYSQPQNSINTNNNVISSSHHHLQHRKSFPPPSSKVFRAAAAPVWKPGDEIISVSVPRKARSSSAKRSHDWISSSSNNSGGGVAGGGEQVLRQESSSPVRQDLVSTQAAPMSPSSSNALFRKKLKHSGNNSGAPNLKPPKASLSKQSYSNPEELEIEIAEVLYGLKTQSQDPSSKKEDSKEVNRSNSDGKSSPSPISNSNSANNQISVPPNSSPLQAVAPKRKRPRQVMENCARSSPSAKLVMDQTQKTEISSPDLEKISGSNGGNGFENGGHLVTQGQSMKVDLEVNSVAQEFRESRDLVAKNDVSSPKEKESPAVGNQDNILKDANLIATASVASTMIKANSMMSEVENERQQKFEIYLMAPPPQVKSPEREAKIHLRATATAADQNRALSIVDEDMKAVVSNDKVDQKGEIVKDHLANVAAGGRKGKGTGEEVESKKEIENKGRSVDLQLDLEKPDRNGNSVLSAPGNKLQQQQEMTFKVKGEEQPTEKSTQSKSSLPLPLPMPGLPGGLPPMGYAPLQGVVSMDAGALPPAPIPPLFSQPRPKRCATHCYVARNIHYLQQFVKMNPFWHAAAGSASLFGSKPGNLNAMSTDPHGNVAGRGLSNAHDKGNGLACSPNHSGRDKGSQTASTSDSAQRKQQIIIQQPLPPVAASNLLGPAFIFPLNQHQAAAAATSARPSSTKSASSDTSCSGASASAAAAMSFNYPTMAANETQYLAILQNNGYPFPIPAVGPPPNYRGTPGQAMPLFNNTFYPSQMIHPSQLQHQQTPSSQLSQLQQALPSGSSSQKHPPSQQQRPQSSSVDGGAGSRNSQNFSGPKSQPSQQLSDSNNHNVNPSRPRHLDRELGSDGSHPTTDNRGSRASMNFYGPNFAMPFHPQNFALMTPPAALASSAVSGSSNQTEKKPQQPQHSLPPHSFAMSFGPINGGNTGPGIDIASMAQNHAIFQSFPEATRHNFQMMAAAAAAAQVAQKNFRMSEDDKSGGGDSSTTDADRKNLVARVQRGVGQSNAFMRSNTADVPVSQASNIIESSGRFLNVPSGNARGSRSVSTNAVGAINGPNNGQLQQQQQQLGTSAVSRSKAPVTSNGSIFSEHLNSSSIAKIPNSFSGFPQNLVQSNNTSPTQSPQWRNSTRPQTAQALSSLASSTQTTQSNLSQPHSRQMHTQISFGGNQKPSASQGQAPPSSSNQAPSPPMMVGSPTTSSISKGASGSPRTNTSASTNSKIGQNSSLSYQQPKNSPSVPSQKSPSILGHPHVVSSSSSGTKRSMQQQPQPTQQQQLPKNMQQAQLLFSNPYSQAHSPHPNSTSSTNSVPSGFYTQRRRTDQQQHPAQQQPVGLPPSAAVSVSTNDPAKAIAAATTNVKGGGLTSQAIINAGSLIPAGFSYVHPVPAAVQVKPAEQKQPAA